MQTTVEHKYSIGDIVYVAELKESELGIDILKYRITDDDIIFREDKLSFTPKDALDKFMDKLRENTYGLV